MSSLATLAAVPIRRLEGLSQIIAPFGGHCPFAMAMQGPRELVFLDPVPSPLRGRPLQSLVSQRAAYSAATRITGAGIALPLATSLRTRMEIGTEGAFSSASASISPPGALETLRAANLATLAPCAVVGIPPSLVANIFPIVTPLRPEAWRAYLNNTGLLDEFADVVLGIIYGFSRGIEAPVPFTRVSPNHPSALVHAEFIDSLIITDIAEGRYSEPYDPCVLEALIGPFLTSPLAVVTKPDSGKKRLVQNHSYPRLNPDVPSPNSFIDPSRFKCDWGTFTNCFLIVARAPAGTQASVFDVDKAF